MAAAGMPEAREDHAEVMAIFATRCLKEMSRVASALEATLGPDTGDLQVSKAHVNSISLLFHVEPYPSLSDVSRSDSRWSPFWPSDGRSTTWSQGTFSAFRR